MSRERARRGEAATARAVRAAAARASAEGGMCVVMPKCLQTKKSWSFMLAVGLRGRPSCRIASATAPACDRARSDSNPALSGVCYIVVADVTTQLVIAWNEYKTQP